MNSFQLATVLVLVSFLQLLSGVNSATFTIINNCSYTIWPGIISGAGTSQLNTTGFTLQPGASYTLDVPTSWSGRLWGRTFCTQDSTGKFTCATGNCGSSTIECAGSGAAPPATLAEFTLNGAGGLDFYVVSLVDGYNLPMTVVPQGGTGGNCSTTGCVADLNRACPAELKVIRGDASVACKSACEAFGDPQYCCSGSYSSPATCKPSSYSEFFKTACPRAYSFAYDDGTSTFTCASADYRITFCPLPSTPSLYSNVGGDGSKNYGGRGSTDVGGDYGNDSDSSHVGQTILIVVVATATPIIVAAIVKIIMKKIFGNNGGDNGSDGVDDNGVSDNVNSGGGGNSGGGNNNNIAGSGGSNSSGVQVKIELSVMGHDL